MRIIKRAKILPCTCECCGTVYKPSKSDVRNYYLGDEAILYSDCPFCRKSNKVLAASSGEDAEHGKANDSKNDIDLVKLVGRNVYSLLVVGNDVEIVEEMVSKIVICMTDWYADTYKNVYPSAKFGKDVFVEKKDAERALRKERGEC